MRAARQRGPSRLPSSPTGYPHRQQIALLQFCYKTGFTETKVVQFHALLARLKHSLDSIICSLREFIQNSPNWLLTSGSQVRVLHGSFNEIKYLRAVRDGRSTCFCYNSQRCASPKLDSRVFSTTSLVILPITIF